MRYSICDTRYAIWLPQGDARFARKGEPRRGAEGCMEMLASLVGWTTAEVAEGHGGGDARFARGRNFGTPRNDSR